MAKLTVHSFLAAKGQRQLTQTFTTDAAQAKACNDAGLDVLVTMDGRIGELRKAAPDTFLVSAIDFTEAAASDESAIRAALSATGRGADAIYLGAHDLDRVKALARAAVPVIGHVGLVPYRNTWVGGMRAVGKTAAEAKDIYDRTKAYEEAGAISVEMEVVPELIASEISKRTSMIVISMGSGSGCDGQYLFAEDMLGLNGGHVPRHAKQYADLQPQYDKLHTDMVAAFEAFKHDVDSGAYPQRGHCVRAKPQVVDEFLNSLNEG